MTAIRTSDRHGTDLPSASGLASAKPPRHEQGTVQVASAQAPAVVYLLADHLDAILAHGEDLLAISWRPTRLGRCAATIAENQACQRAAIDEIRLFELALVARALNARERARELATIDGRFAPLARVFAAATASLDEAAREAGDSTREDFETGDGILAYMRSHGLLAADTAALDDCGAIVMTPSFLVAQRIALEPLLDLVAGFLDALEAHYELYPDTGAAGPAAESADDTAPTVA